MELLLSWYETQEQKVLRTVSTSDGCDYYECWEPVTVQTSPCWYKRTKDFQSLRDAQAWCEQNSTENTHYFAFIPDSFEERQYYLKRCPVAEKWYDD